MIEILYDVEKLKDRCVKSGDYKDFYDYSIKNGLVTIDDNGFTKRDIKKTFEHLSNMANEIYNT